MGDGGLRDLLVAEHPFHGGHPQDMLHLLVAGDGGIPKGMRGSQRGWGGSQRAWGDPKGAGTSPCGSFVSLAPDKPCCSHQHT